MSKFCNQCGANKETNPCSCATTNATTPVQENQEASAAMQNLQEAASQTLQQAASIINIDQEKADALMKNAKATSSNIFALCKKVLSNNTAAIHAEITPQETKNRLTLGITQLVVLCIISMMSLSSFSYYISFGTRLLASIFAVITLSSLVVAPACVAFLAARKNNPSASFVDILGVFSVATLLPTTLYVVVCIVTQINAVLGILIIFTVFISYIIHIYEAVLASTQKTKDGAIRTLYLVYVLTFIAISVMSVITTMVIGNQLANLFMGSFDSIMNELMYGLY